MIDITRSPKKDEDVVDEDCSRPVPLKVCWKVFSLCNSGFSGSGAMVSRSHNKEG